MCANTQQRDPALTNSPAVRSAFTLLELLLVLTIIVVIGAMAIPALDRMMERQRLRAAADEMRLAWDDARLKAMRTGQPQLFQCQIGSNSYSVQPLILFDNNNTIGAGATMMNGGMAVETSTSNFGMSMTAVDPAKAADSTALDESLKFASCNIASDTRAYAIANSGETAAINQVNVNQSVIFYPDGTTSTAELRVQNERGDTTGVQIRGLTGHTRILPFEGVGEVSQ